MTLLCPLYSQLSMKRERFSSMEANDVESQVLSKVYEDMQQRYVGFDDPAHGWEHIKRVYRLALYVAEQENADAFIVGMAALMHDIGHLSTDKSLHHADLSMAVANELILAYDVSYDTREAILHAIVAHSFSLGIEARTLEAKVVRVDDRRYMLDHFYNKLLKLDGTMATQAGRTLAEQRTAFMLTYMKEFRRELEL